MLLSRAGVVGARGLPMLAVPSRSWGDQRPSLADYVTGPGPRVGPRSPRVVMLPSLPRLYGEV
jgi:hypothetical protein